MLIVKRPVMTTTDGNVALIYLVIKVYVAFPLHQGDIYVYIFVVIVVVFIKWLFLSICVVIWIAFPLLCPWNQRLDSELWSHFCYAPSDTVSSKFSEEVLVAVASSLYLCKSLVHWRRRCNQFNAWLSFTIYLALSVNKALRKISPHIWKSCKRVCVCVCVIERKKQQPWVVKVNRWQERYLTLI